MSRPPTPGPLILAIPSKGRLKEQAEDWLTDCGLPVRAAGGERGYPATEGEHQRRRERDGALPEIHLASFG